MSARTRALSFALGCITLSVSAACWAQDSAAAQALFERGVEDLEAGRLEVACPALAESLRLDPHPGTLFALAECEAKAGKLASAVGHYQDYVGWVSRLSIEQQERHADRVAAARQQTTALRPRVPTLTLLLPAAAPSGLVVERDGVALKGPALGLALPVDPGQHSVVTRDADGYETRVTIEVAEGEALRVELRVPAEPVPAPVAAPVVPVEAPKPSQPAVSPPPLEGHSSTLRRWGWVAGGVGVSGLVVGSIAGAMAIRQKEIVNRHCLGAACDGEGTRAVDSGRSAAAISTVAFGVGLAGVGASLVLLLTGSNDASAIANCQPSIGFLAGAPVATVTRQF